MSQLTAAQVKQVGQLWAQSNYVAPNVTATMHSGDIEAAVSAIDNAFDTTLSAAVIAVGGATTIINGLNAILPAPFSGATVAQKTMLVCWVLMKRVGLI
jgi:hypothetical protein